MKKIIITVLFALLLVNSNAQSKKDTTKAAVDTSTLYFLVGKLPDFNFLYSALKSPGDVTPNQVNAILVWIEKNVQAVPKEKKK